MTAVVAHDTFRNTGGAGGVQDVQRIGRRHRHTISRLSVGECFRPIDVTAGDQFGFDWGRCRIMQRSGLCFAKSIALSSIGL